MSEQSSNDEQEGKVPLEMKDLKKLYACVKCRLIKSEGSVKKKNYMIFSSKLMDVKTVVTCLNM